MIGYKIKFLYNYNELEGIIIDKITTHTSSYSLSITGYLVETTENDILVITPDKINKILDKENNLNII